jgi:hypothetical protein
MTYRQSPFVGGDISNQISFFLDKLSLITKRKIEKISRYNPAYFTLALASHNPKCARMTRITDGSSMLMIPRPASVLPLRASLLDTTGVIT